MGLLRAAVVQPLDQRLPRADGRVQARSPDGSAPRRGRLAWRALAAALLALTLGAGLYAGLSGGGRSPAARVRSHRFSRQGLLRLPATARGVVSATLGANSRSYHAIPLVGGFSAANPAQRLSSKFSSSGVSVASGATRLGLSVRAMGFGSSLAALAAVAPRADGNRVEYRRLGLSEWYVNGPLGLEQGFTLAHAPAPQVSGPLTLALALSGNARPSLAKTGEALTLTRGGKAVLRYDGLSATDARGHALHSWMALEGGRLLLRVQAHGARYPLRIDPYVLQAMVGGEPSFGYSVALSADGNTALVGAPEAYPASDGGAWIFARSGATWTEQKRVFGPEETERWEIGRSVALSADGNTALIGAPHAHLGHGAVIVLTRTSSEGLWFEGQFDCNTAEPELCEKEEVGFGSHVALSGDGSTALVGSGGPKNRMPATWAFVRSGSEFIQHGGPLAPVAAPLALSYDGNTGLIGGTVFARSGETWSEQAVLAGSPGSVALSEDGNTALIGFAGCCANAYTRSEGAWSKQGELNNSGGGGEFGAAVALSSDGNTALVGAPREGGETNTGRAYFFSRSGSIWTPLESVTVEKDERQHPGFSVALSSDASTALIGGPAVPEEGGEVVILHTTPTAPYVVTGEAASVTLTSGTLNATVNPDGETVTDCHFEYGTSSASGSSVPCSALPGSGVGPVPVSASISGLSPATTYYFRAVASNAQGTAYGEERRLVTPAPPPTVVTGEASEVTGSSAVLNAIVNPNGYKVSDCHFEYGTTTAYGASVPCSQSPEGGKSPVPVTAFVTGLSASTTYHFRIVATNANGTSTGEDRTFTSGVMTEPVFVSKAILGETVATHIPITGTLGTALLEAKSGTKVSCEKGSFAGEITGLKATEHDVAVFQNCESGGQPCGNTGERQITTKSLAARLQGITENLPGERLGAESAQGGVERHGIIAEFSCAGVTAVVVKGTLIGKFSGAAGQSAEASQTGKILTSAKLTFAQQTGIQQYCRFSEGTAEDRECEQLEASVGGGAYEQAGESLIATIKTVPASWGVGVTK